MLFTTFSCCCGPSGTYHIPVFLFMVPLIVSSPFFWMYNVCLTSLMVNSSSHKIHNDINGDAYIFGEMWMCLSSLLRLCSWSVYICVKSIVLPSGSLASVSLSIITGAILGVACLARCIFAPEYAIASMLLLIWLGGLLIQFIELILGLLILILLTIAPNCHSRPFSLPPIIFL